MGFRLHRRKCWEGCKSIQWDFPWRSQTLLWKVNKNKTMFHQIGVLYTSPCLIRIPSIYTGLAKKFVWGFLAKPEWIFWPTQYMIHFCISFTCLSSFSLWKNHLRSQRDVIVPISRWGKWRFKERKRLAPGPRVNWEVEYILDLVVLGFWASCLTSGSQLWAHIRIPRRAC